MTVTEAPTPTAPEDTPVQPVPTTSKALELRTMNDKLDYANTLSNSSLLPASYRGKPANVLLAVEYGAMLGLHPIAAIQNIHVIEGKLCAAASLLQSLARKAGHTVRIKSKVDKDGLPVGVCQIIRCDDPDFVFETEFTIADAVRAGLCTINKQDGQPYKRGKSGEPTNWEKWPRAMVKHRALAECVRDACQEALLGVMYTPEELGAEVDAEGNLVAFPDGSAEAATENRAAAHAAAADADIADAEIVEELAPEEMRRMLMLEIMEIASIIEAPVMDAARPIARAVDNLDNDPDDDATRNIIMTADPHEVLRVLGPMRGAIVARLHAKGQHAAAETYLRAGAKKVAPVEELFGRPPQGQANAPQAHTDGAAPGPQAGPDTAPPDTVPADTAPEQAPDPAPDGWTDGAPDAAEVTPHPFESREDDADACAECRFPAHDPIHDPMRGM